MLISFYEACKGPQWNENFSQEYAGSDYRARKKSLENEAEAWLKSGDDDKPKSKGGGGGKGNSGRGPAGSSGLGGANKALSILDIKKKYPGKGFYIDEQKKLGFGEWKSQRVKNRRKIAKLEEWIEAHPDKDDAVRVQSRLKEISSLKKEINILQDLEDMYF